MHHSAGLGNASVPGPLLVWPGRRRGFTLIELLLVISLLGLLASFVVPRFVSMKNRAYYAAMRNDLRNLYIQMELNYETFSVYPANYVTTGPATATQVALKPTVNVNLNWVTLTSTAYPPGYIATATHAKLGSSEKCSYAVGATYTANDNSLVCTTPQQ